MRKRLFLLCLSLTAFAQFGVKAQQQGKIHGVWQNNQFGYQMTLMLQPDGTGEFDGEPIKFSTQGNSLSITVGTTITKYVYSLQENSLTLSGGDLDGQVVFSRSGSESPAVVVEKNTSTSGTTSSQSYSNTDKNLLGLWSGNGEMIEFKPDGKCVYLGNTFNYQISRDHIILSTGQGNATFGYKVAGKQLMLTANNGQQVVYNRAEGGGPGNQSDGKSISMELVGQWCYLNMNNNSQTSRCIVLNADGSYNYSFESSRSVNTEAVSGGTSSQNSDRGTWYLRGDRIHYNSQSSGPGSYRLEKRNHPKNVNDPMIVLDGEPFVTMTRRAPWR
ncbi:MAG: hypothetical protein WDN75_03645 [Bacteroidota bacterium]